ncbi:uncharacterized protein LOC113011287 isoform X1 [Astatotilapia calliptera]|uniref:uncharacterized protein LOC113011287 isoform X1 n=1 Tax=Astatotilapia calliptera TaxID=8154 RepID=UPI000E3FF3EE|nr:uncharacterized protein LOC113011287 isoform X1 [Astatotilapia calliptera]
MERIVFFSAFLWLCSCEVNEFQYVFVRHGKDLHLDIGRSVVLDKKTDLIWKFNKTNNVAKCAFNNDPVVFDKYEGRAELFRQNYSLLLKNVQHSDSGDYTALMVSNVDQKVAEYKVIVQDAVSPVDLTVDSVSGSSDSCNLTVTCSTVDSQISSIFTCDAQNCSQVEENSLKTPDYYSSLIVYLHGDFIICNHSNKVSWTDSKTKHYCDTRTVSSANIIIAAAGGLCGFIFIIVIICIVAKRKRRNQENQLYEAAQEHPPGQTRNENVPGDASSLSPTSTYALVEFHPKTESTKSKKIPQPETVYAQVTRPTRPRVTAQQTELENISSINSQG